jgi:hypothetical protein
MNAIRGPHKSTARQTFYGSGLRYCPICSETFAGRDGLLGHLANSPYEDHGMAEHAEYAETGTVYVALEEDADDDDINFAIGG